MQLSLYSHKYARIYFIYSGTPIGRVCRYIRHINVRQCLLAARYKNLKFEHVNHCLDLLAEIYGSERKSQRLL